MKRRTISTLLLAGSCAVSVACSDPAANGAITSNVPGQGTDAGATNDGAAGADSAANGGGFDAASTSGDAGGTFAGSDAGGSPEVCDGIDNDKNGIVDDLDVGGDGVCDCLLIATLGKPGAAGKGDVFSAWLDARSDTGAASLDNMVLTPELLKKYQVIVAQNVSTIGRTYSADEIKALSDWIKAGGGLLTLIGYADPGERTNVNALLAPFGLSYGATQILQKSGGSTVPVMTWLGPHPVVDGISKVGIDNGYPVMGTGTLLAQAGGYDVLKVQEAGQGHIIVWADEWITFDSEWKDHPDYQVERFWLNMIKWLTATKICQVPVPIQ